MEENFDLKKPFSTRIDHISIESHLLVSQVHFEFKKNDLDRNGEKSWMPISTVHDEK
jgi:hypothetical protein